MTSRLLSNIFEDKQNKLCVLILIFVHDRRNIVRPHEQNTVDRYLFEDYRRNSEHIVVLRFSGLFDRKPQVDLWRNHDLFPFLFWSHQKGMEYIYKRHLAKDERMAELRAN